MFGIKTWLKIYIDTHYGPFSKLSNVRISPVGYKCTAACPMCWRLNISPKEQKQLSNNDKKQLSLEEYKTIFSDMPSSVRTVDIVGGGEPLLFPHIEELFKVVKQRKISGRLITNGSLMNRKIIVGLIDSHWDEVRFSFHAGSPEVYQKILGVSNYHKVVENIRLLRKLRGDLKVPNISLLFVMQRDNVKDVFKFAKLAESLGVDEIEFDTLIPTNKNLLLTLENTREIIGELRKIRKEIYIRHNINYVIKAFSRHPRWNNNMQNNNYFNNKYCQIVQSNLDISSSGDVTPCCIADGYYKYSNIRNKSISQIWKDSRPFRKALRNGNFLPFCYQWCNYELSIR